MQKTADTRLVSVRRPVISSCGCRALRCFQPDDLDGMHGSTNDSLIHFDDVVCLLEIFLTHGSLAEGFFLFAAAKGSLILEIKLLLEG